MKTKRTHLPVAHALVLLALALLLAPASVTASDAPLFRYEGFDYYPADLAPALRQTLFEAQIQHYEAARGVADESLFELRVLQLAEESGKSVDVVRSELLAVDPPGEQDIEAFYEANKARIPAPLDQVRDRISLFLTEQAAQARRSAVVEEMKREAEFELLVPAPIAPQVEIDTDGFPYKGSADASVTVVEFSDFQCPHCQRASGTLSAIAGRYGDQIRFVYMDFPINRSGISRMVARGAACAHEQGRFWQYHDLAFERQPDLSQTSPATLAADAGLDMQAFERCYEGPQSAERVEHSEAEAIRLGVSATPTLFVNGRRLVIEDLERDLTQAIERALAEQG